MIDTAGTLSAAAQAIKDAGGPRGLRLRQPRGALGPGRSSASWTRRSQEVIITDTIPLRAEVRACPKIKVSRVARLLGEAIKRIHHGDSISSLFI